MARNSSERAKEVPPETRSRTSLCVTHAYLVAFLDRTVRFRVRLRSLVSLTLTVTRFSLRFVLRTRRVHNYVILTFLLVEVL